MSKLGLTWICVSLLLAACAGHMPAQEDRSTAAQLYEEGAYRDAAERWASIAAAEPYAVDAPFNAAQAYLQADDLGRAMLYFRRAQALDPRHSAVQLGLALVRALRVDILGDDPGLLPAVERLTAEVVSIDELAWLTAGAWTVGVALMTASLFRRRLRWWGAVVLGAATVLILLLVGRDLSQRTAPSAVVTAFETTLSSEPSDAGVPLSRLYAGAEARIGDSRAGWILLLLADGRAGWVPAAHVERVTPR